MGSSWRWRFEGYAETTPRLLLENSLDMEHLTVLHTELAYVRILEKGDNASLMEIGTKLWFFVVRSLEWVQYLPPDKLVYRSSLFWGTMDIRNDTTAFPSGTGAVFRQDYTVTPAWFWRPLKPLLLWRMKRWRQKVWLEDKPLLERRHRLQTLGFRDGSPVLTVATMNDPVPAPITV